MKFTPTLIPDVILVEADTYKDSRGYFREIYNFNKFYANGIEHRFVQDNYSHSCGGVLRGLHYQIYHAQGKLIRVINGAIYDVAVDIRKNSPYFKHWVQVYLSADIGKQLWIPPGFAHGFYACQDGADVIYKITDYYYPEHERCILWNDKTLGIKWHLHNNVMPILSKKDKEGKSLLEAELFE